MPACDAPVRYRDTDAVRADIANLRAAVDGTGAEDAFLSAASPGVVAFFLKDGHLRGPAPPRHAAAQHRRHRARRPAVRDLVRGAANPRHAHEWRVFEDVKLPDGKALIPGVVDSTTNYIEHPELVAQRIVRYARLVGRENVIAGTDCGFASFAGSAAVDPAIVWAKLAAMAEGAALASRELW